MPGPLATKMVPSQVPMLVEHTFQWPTLPQSKALVICRTRWGMGKWCGAFFSSFSASSSQLRSLCNWSVLPSAHFKSRAAAVGNCPVHCGLLNRISGFYAVPTTASFQCLQILPNRHKGTKVTLVEKHWFKPSEIVPHIYRSCSTSNNHLEQEKKRWWKMMVHFLSSADSGQDLWRKADLEDLLGRKILFGGDMSTQMLSCTQLFPPEDIW